MRAGIFVTAVLAMAACTAPPPGAGGLATPSPGACAAALVETGAPPPRANATFAFDVDRRVMVLFGGATSNTVNGLDDTWTWDGQAWTQQHPAHSPPGASYAAMAYDVIHHRMVLYEPAHGDSVPPQTWTWDGTDWTQENPVHTPPTRIEAAMAADPSRNGVVLVGGTNAGDLSDVWAWDGTDWTQVAPDAGPIFGAAHALLASPKGGGSLLVVGNSRTYKFESGSWTPYGSGDLPPGNYFVGNVVYDTGATEPIGFVRFGDKGETWTWLPGRDSSWQILKPPCSPPARWANTFRPAMAYDGWRGVVVLFGGRDRNDTWTFDGRTWSPAPSGVMPTPSPSPAPSPGTGWSQLPDLSIGRIDHTATRLADGRVLLVGGGLESETNSQASAEIFDPKTNRWSSAAPMANPRQRHTATLLPDGKVLVVGGLGPGRGTAELYDPTTNSWSSGGALVQPRANHQAVLLSDGTVLVLGGRQPGKPLADAEIYQPTTRTWTAVAPLSVARDRPVALRLRNGKVLVTGGVTTDVGGSLDAAVLFGNPLSSTELYDPASKTWSPGAPMATGRVGHVMTLLADGRVLVVGGTRDPSAAELYDPVRDSWVAVGSALSPRIAPAIGLLGDGRVLVAGGLIEKYDPATVATTGYNPVLLATADVFDPVLAAWTSVAPMREARWLATGTTLLDGRVLVCGGGNPMAAGSHAVEAYPVRPVAA
ncbi:MAG TPA: kelch repeat-containing protein [Candidatus Limnocylindrales bacterium]|nr:kelch repeat-containing protein [Candidatus Limnocylindrales bacterium]